MPSNGQNGQTKHLTSDKEAFCQAMALHSTTDLNQSEVYAQTHDVSTLNHKTICEMASRLMADSKIVARIEELRRPVVERFQVHHEAWLFRLMGMAFADVRRAFDTHGNPIDIPDLPDDIAPNVAGYEQVEDFSGRGESRERVGYTKKVKLIPPLEAMKLFGEALQWFPSNAGGKFGVKAEIKDRDRTIKIELVRAEG